MTNASVGIEAELDRLDETRASSVKGAVAAILGNALEFYDFTVYAFFAVTIGRQFFPTHTAYGSLLLSMATFGVGFITRPLGAIVIGTYADRRGRKPAMTLTIVLMAISTGLIGLVPSYAAIGIWAPCLVVLARLIQGFSAGGEMGPATNYLLESAPPGTRAYFASWQNASQGISLLLAGGVGFAATSLLPAAELESWGWRVTFLVGIIIAPVGFYIRSRLPETLGSADGQRHSLSILSRVATQHYGTVILGILVILGGTVTFYVANYMTTYALTTLHLPAGVAMLVPLVMGLSVVIPSVIGGWLADRIGRKPVLILPRLLLIAAAYPAFVIITELRTPAALLLLSALLMTLQSLSGAIMSVILPESFPKAVRTTGFSIIYTVGVSLFGGTTQFVTAWLIGATGDPLCPAYYLIVTNIVCVVASLFLRETKSVAID